MVTEGGDFTHLIVPHVVRKEKRRGEQGSEISTII